MRQDKSTSESTAGPLHNSEPKLKELREKVNSLTTEAAVNWALKEMESLRRTVFTEEITAIQSLEELKTLQDRLKKCQDKDWVVGDRPKGEDRKHL